MEGICGEALINLNQTWYTSHPTLSSCISRTILLLLPSFLILLSIIISSVGACSRDSKKRPVSWVIISRILLLVLALSVHAAQAALELQENRNAISDYVFFCIMSAIILLNIVVEILHQLTGTYTSAVQFFFWMSQVLCCLPALKQNIDNLTSDSQLLSSSLSTVFIVFNIVLLITQWFPNWKTGHPSEDETPFPSWLTFSWMSNCF